MDGLHSPDLFFFSNSSRNNVTGLWRIWNAGNVPERITRLDGADNRKS
jgi:hypothetical protein